MNSSARRTIQSSAPIRVCDLGGWTDTWFAGHGAVCSIAVAPRVNVEARTYAIDERSDLLTIDALGAPGPHPLVEAVVEEIGIPAGVALKITVSCEAQPGSSTGTSASVAVAVAGALDALHPRDQRHSRQGIAAAAHRAEHVRLGRQCGVQDQLAAAHGGINWIQMTSFPEATVTPLSVAAATRSRLDRDLCVVFLGQPHDSSSVHQQVIAELESGDVAPGRLERLRQCAVDGRDALLAGDLVAYGKVLSANTEAQAELNDALVSPAALAVIALARDAGALGWKVNGAGGDGGSVSVLGDGQVDLRAALIDAGWSIIPTRLSLDGLRVSETAG